MVLKLSDSTHKSMFINHKLISHIHVSVLHPMEHGDSAINSALLVMRDHAAESYKTVHGCVQQEFLILGVVIAIYWDLRWQEDVMKQIRDALWSLSGC